MNRTSPQSHRKHGEPPWLKNSLKFIECRNKPIRFYSLREPQGLRQGHESFDYTQDTEVLEGQRRMASFFHHSLSPTPANAPPEADKSASAASFRGS